MNNITIDFSGQTLSVSNYCLGRIGEHNATQLTITPPAILSEDERTASYLIAFGTGGEIIKSSTFTASPIVISLWQQLTLHTKMSIQVEAYDASGEFIGKSEKVSGFYFAASVDGMETAADDEAQSLAGEVAANTAARHTHENKEVLDKFGESEGEPTFDGEPIGGTALVEILQQGIYARYTATELIALYVKDKIFTYGGNIVTNIRTASNLFTFSVLEYEVYNSVKTPVLRSYSVNSSKQITQESDAKSQLFLPYSVNGKTFANANAVTLKAADITASAGWSPTDDKDLATKKYVDDNAGGGGGFYVGDTAPLDTSLLWIDISDNTIEGLADADNSEY